MLKIPTVADRAWQAIAKYALEPACALQLSTPEVMGLELGDLLMMHKSTSLITYVTPAKE